MDTIARLRCSDRLRRFSPPVAAILLALLAVKLVLLWHVIGAASWNRVAAVFHVSATGFGGLTTIAITLSLLFALDRPTRSDLGLTPRQLGVGLGVGLAIWLAYQAGALLDRRLFGAMSLSFPSLVTFTGALWSAYGEELVFRLVLIGGLLSLLGERGAVRLRGQAAFAIALAIFMLFHIPHDIVRETDGLLVRYLALAGDGALLIGVYVTSRNLALATAIHLLANQPALLAAGPNAEGITWTINWLASLAVIAWYARRSPRRPEHGTGSNSACRTTPRRGLRATT